MGRRADDRKVSPAIWIDASSYWCVLRREFSGMIHFITTKWGPQTIAKLVNITPMSLWFMVPITIVNEVYKPSYNWGPTL